MQKPIETLTPEMQEAIRAISLTNFTQAHMPIATYAAEMGGRADLLLEDAESIQGAIGFYVTDLATEVEMVKSTLLEQEIQWIDGNREQDEKTRFWHGNKENLYNYNRELSARLDLHFTLTGNDHGISVLSEIGTSTTHGDAVHDGRRFARIIKEEFGSLTGNLYSEDELNAFITFYETIEDSKEAADIDRTAPHDDRILRDKIYLHLRSLETMVKKVTRAAFINEPLKLDRYESAFIHKKNLNSKR